MNIRIFDTLQRALEAGLLSTQGGALSEVVARLVTRVVHDASVLRQFGGGDPPGPLHRQGPATAPRTSPRVRG